MSDKVTKSDASASINTSTSISASESIKTSKAGKAHKTRKKDKRSIATERAIKDALLTALKSVRFDQLTVSSICDDASITRATFYQHYGNLADVLDELLDDMATDMGDIPFEMCEACAGGGYRRTDEYVCSGMPFCHFLASGNKYRVLLDDNAIAERLIYRIVDSNLDEIMRRLKKRFPNTELERAQLKYFNVFRMNGCLAAAKAAQYDGYDWSRMQPSLDSAIAAAFETLQ